MSDTLGRAIKAVVIWLLPSGALLLAALLLGPLPGVRGALFTGPVFLLNVWMALYIRRNCGTGTGI